MVPYIHSGYGSRCDNVKTTFYFYNAGNFIRFSFIKNTGYQYYISISISISEVTRSIKPQISTVKAALNRLVNTSNVLERVHILKLYNNIFVGHRE